MNCEATFSNVPPTIYNELITFIWSRGGFVRVDNETSVSLLAEDKVFYSIKEECSALLLGNRPVDKRG